MRAVLGDEVVDHAEMLLEPSVIYSPTVLETMATGAVHAAAHVTGGGLAANLDRSLPDGLGATIDTASWERPAVFSLIAERGVSETEMQKTFNLGVGFCLIVERESVDSVLELTSQHSPRVIGRVHAGSGVLLD